MNINANFFGEIIFFFICLIAIGIVIGTVIGVTALIKGMASRKQPPQD